MRVVNFICPQPPKKETVKVKTIDKNTFNDKDKSIFVTSEEDSNKGDIIAAKTPSVTTLYFYYEGVDDYNGDTKNNEESYATGYVGLAKASGDTNKYYIKIDWDETQSSSSTSLKPSGSFKPSGSSSSSSSSDSDYEEMTDLTGTKDNDSFMNALVSFVKKVEGKIVTAKNIKLATDKDGKNVVRDIEITNGTPESPDAAANDKDKGYTSGKNYDDAGNEEEKATKYTPNESAAISNNDGKNANLEVKSDIVQHCKHEWEEQTMTNKTKWVCKKCTAETEVNPFEGSSKLPSGGLNTVSTFAGESKIPAASDMEELENKKVLEDLEEPSAPETPETPATPETPETPATLETPETPATPETLETPATPATPATSETPATPATPETPATSETPATPETPAE